MIPRGRSRAKAACDCGIGRPKRNERKQPEQRRRRPRDGDAIVLVQLLVQYRLNLWNRDFFNALGRRDGAALWSEAQIFLPLAAASILLAAVSVWARMRVQRKWREALTVHVASFWLLDCHYSRLDYEATGNKNPEYRITDDVRVATDAPIDLALGLLSSYHDASKRRRTQVWISGRNSPDWMGY